MVKTKVKENVKPEGKGAPKDVKEYPFLVKVVLTYTQYNDAGVEQKKKDNVVFKLTAEGARKPWYVLRNYLVPRYLTQQYGPEEVGWQRVYEIKIIKLINRENPGDITDIPIRVMTKEQLDLYCERWGLNVPVDEFYSVEVARDMVMLRMEDEKGFLKQLADYREGKKRIYPELDGVRGSGTAELGTEDEFEELDGGLDRSRAGKKKKKPTPSLQNAGEVVGGEKAEETEPGETDPFDNI